jgi:hypothetical protein
VVSGVGNRKFQKFGGCCRFFVRKRPSDEQDNLFSGLSIRLYQPLHPKLIFGGIDIEYQSQPITAGTKPGTLSG